MSNQANMSWPGWETVRLIGRGSFGAVYEIQREIRGRIEHAALKVISIPQDDNEIQELKADGYDDESITQYFTDSLEKIEDEYAMMADLKGHSNVVYCDDIRTVQHDDGFGWDIYIKMELLTPMRNYLQDEVADAQVIKLGMDICAALKLCEELNIVHRDIKPENIFVSRSGSFKLGDFGIAKTMEGTTGGTKTGTYDYMAPEVYSNRPYHTQADIYSLGLVMYWLLNKRTAPFLPQSGKRPTPSAKTAARDRRFSGEKIPAPLCGSKELQRIVLKACAFDPKDRYQSAMQMYEALANLTGAVTTSVKNENVPVPEPDAAPVFASEEEKTVGPVFAPSSNGNAVEEEKTVGPVFKPETKQQKDNQATRELQHTAEEKHTKAQTSVVWKTIVAIAAAGFLLLTALLFNFGPDRKNDEVVKSTETENYDEVIDMYLKQYAEQKKNEQLSTAKVGDYIKFGAYEQDNNTSNGKEAIEWLVLDVQDDRMLVISKYALDCKKYHDDAIIHTDGIIVTWKNCSLRTWLNSEFMNEAFSDEEKKCIFSTNVDTSILDWNKRAIPTADIATQDLVFLLSFSETIEYFDTSSARQCEATAYAEDKGATTQNQPCKWWLRNTIGSDYNGMHYDSYSYYVNDIGFVTDYEWMDKSGFAVRPAMWIELNS